jgi:very-short-patch-repair endonuclease
MRRHGSAWASGHHDPPHAIDIGEASSQDDVELAYECARRRRQTHDQRLKRRLQGLGLKGRKGCATLDRIIALHEAKAPTGSALEVRFLQLNRRFRLPDPQCQRIIRDRDGSVARVDFIYPGTVVIVEVDGRSVHSRARQLETDLRRRNRLTSDGYCVLHVTYERMRTDPSGVAREIGLALARRLG